jgi:NodT family efflux transporter outer membrane factor (OMF) lipoprotein
MIFIKRPSSFYLFLKKKGEKFFLFLLCFLPHCTVGPDYEKPSLDVPSQWISHPHSSSPSSPLPVAPWWEGFQDSFLTYLMEKAIRGNLDLKIAEARLKEAHAQRQELEGSLFPSFMLGGSVRRQTNSLAIPGFQLTKPWTAYSPSLTAQWNLDLFGEQRRQREAASALEEGTQAQKSEVKLNLCRTLAHTYMDFRLYQHQLLSLQGMIHTQEKILTIMASLQKWGMSSEADLIPPRLTMEQYKSQLTFLRQGIVSTQRALESLLGEKPGALTLELAPATPVPFAEAPPILTAPAAVLENRPDIRGAERKLAAATAMQGVAFSQLLPNLSLSGLFGWNTTDGSLLFKNNTQSWNLGGQLGIPILNIGPILSQMEAADARQEQALLSYKKTILNALKEVEINLSSYFESLNYYYSLQKTLQKTQESLSFQEKRYKEGSCALLEVLMAKQQESHAHLNLLQAQTTASQSLVALCTSLGEEEPKEAPSKEGAAPLMEEEYEKHEDEEEEAGGTDPSSQLPKEELPLQEIKEKA